MLIVDGHLDLAFSALAFGRNITLPLDEMISAEPKWARPFGPPAVNIESLLAGGVNLVTGTLFPMPVSANPALANTIPQLCYPDDAPPEYRQQKALASAMRQYDFYSRLVDEDARVRLVKSHSDLKDVLESFESEDALLGIMLHLKGAEAIVESAEIERWAEMGVFSIAPAWDDTVYAPSNRRERAKLPGVGYALLERMLSFNMLCDITHMSEDAAWQVIEMYDGALCASHTSARALVDTEQSVSDAMIRALGERDAVIGISLQNEQLRKRHYVGDRKDLVSLDHVVAHVDHVCQLLGNAEHVAVGSNIDLFSGAKETPTGIDSCADLSKIAALLAERGYEELHVKAIMHNNWLRQFQRILPA